MADGPHNFINPNERFPDTLRFLENAVLQFLQILFSTFPPEPGCFHYDDNDDVRGIEIEGRSTDNLTKTDVRPKIVVYRGPVSWQNRGLGNMVGSRNLSLASRTFTDIVDGTVSVNCFSRERLEADRIANICSDSIKMFREVLNKFGFLSIRSTHVGQPGLIRADAVPVLWVVPVMIEAQVTKNWNKDIVDPVKLRQILIQLSTST